MMQSLYSHSLRKELGEERN